MQGSGLAAINQKWSLYQKACASDDISALVQAKLEHVSGLGHSTTFTCIYAHACRPFLGHKFTPIFQCFGPQVRR